MKKFIFLLIIVFPVFSCTSQQLQNFVISSAGALYSGGGLKIDYTIGETVIEKFQTSNYILTQGFQQTLFTITAVNNIDLFRDVSVYPNPSNDFINIKLSEQCDVSEILLYDEQGRIVHQISTPENEIIRMDVKDLAVGMYFLELIGTTKDNKRVFKIIKHY